jgi:hypothetical protein
MPVTTEAHGAVQSEPHTSRRRNVDTQLNDYWFPKKLTELH